MDRTDELRAVFGLSGLAELLREKRVDYTSGPSEFTALRFVQNIYRLRAIEIWEGTARPWFRIYHGDKIAPELKALIDQFDGFELRASKQYYTDYFGDPQQIATSLKDLLADAGARLAASAPVLAKSSAYEGLELPDVDVSETGVLGRTFNWRELLAIDEDVSTENQLKLTLSQPGVYLQRSVDGKSRYVGSAGGDGGILSRWLHHLRSNGHAKHLNLFVLENGYANVLFTVLEFTTDALKAESRWKETLGTRNAGPYDGLRLNSN